MRCCNNYENKITMSLKQYIKNRNIKDERDKIYNDVKSFVETITWGIGALKEELSGRDCSLIILSES